MKQSRLMSLAEAVTNVAVGYGIAVATRIAVFPLFNITGRLVEHLVIGAIPRVKPEGMLHRRVDPAVIRAAPLV